MGELQHGSRHIRKKLHIVPMILLEFCRLGFILIPNIMLKKTTCGQKTTVYRKTVVFIFAIVYDIAVERRKPDEDRDQNR